MTVWCKRLLFIQLLCALHLTLGKSLARILTSLSKDGNFDIMASSSDDKKISLGSWIKVSYRGSWESQNSNQMNFVLASRGMMFLRFEFELENLKTIEFYVEIYEDEYIEEKNLMSLGRLDLKSANQTNLEGNSTETVFKVDKIFSVVGRQSCAIESSIYLFNMNGVPIDFESDDIHDIVIEGRIKSIDCGLDFSFKAEPNSIDVGWILLFTLFAVSFVVMGINPLYTALRDNNISLILNLSDETFLANICVDIAIIVINTTMVMRSLIEYFEFLTLITMFLMISILFKIRFYLYIFELRVSEALVNPAELTRKKCFFLVKFILACLVAICGSNFLIYYFWGFLVVFLYPVFQIIHNCYHVIKRNCFRWRLHFMFIFAQIFYPLALRAFPNNIFRLRNDFRFAFLLLSIVWLQLALMFFQRYFGPSFFLPRFLIPNYYNYYRKIKPLPGEEMGNCPICFIPLTDQPDVSHDLRTRLVLSRFMETPCKHRFHEQCLQQWMEYKLVCPCCRARIPPY